MPKAPARRCLRAGCSTTSAGPYCPRHQEVRDRESVAHSRGYDKDRRVNDPYRAEYQTERWARTRQRVFARDPLCVACGYRASTVADHKIAAKVWVSLHNGDVNSFYDEANLQGMCVSDHNAKTAKEERHLARVPGVGSIPCK